MKHPQRHALVLLAALGGTLAGTGTAVAVDATFCASVTPSTSATTNRANIQDCLDTYGYAYLQSSGDYPINAGLVLGTDDDLVGVTSAPATIRYVDNLSTDPAALVRFDGNDARVAWVTIDADQNMPTNTDIVRVSLSSAQPSGNVVEDATIRGGSLAALTTVGNHSLDPGPTAVSFRCTACTGNVVRRTEMTDNYRVIGFHGAPSSNANKVETSDIHDNQCDAATFVGYGVLSDNDIYDNGGFCGSGHGGGVYSTGNSDGGKIVGNRIHDICGHGIDLFNSMYMVVEDNDVDDPGQTAADPSHTWCGGAAGLSMLNVRSSTIDGNDVRNLDAPWNMRDDDSPQRKYFSEKNATNYSDLPNGDRTTMAFVMVWDGGSTWTTRSNTITNNVFIATCSSEADCLGLSMFAGRGTGQYSNQTVDSASRNMFWGNRIYGSESRSERLGRNWWGKDYTCTARTDWALDGCNDDDYQWNAPTGTAYRNDPYGGSYASLPL